MDPLNSNNGRPTTSRSRIHPLVATAAGAVIVACGVGVAAMTGILPHAGGTPEANPASSPVAAASSPATNTLAGINPPPSSIRPAPPPPPPQQIAQNTAPVAQPAPPPVRETPSICHTCGTVTNIAEEKTEGHGTGIGAAGGAVAGGLVGHAFGGGNGRIATTVLGALGGGLAGNTVERHIRSTTSYRVSVRMQDGTYHTFRYASAPPVSEGEAVHVVNGVLRAN